MYIRALDNQPIRLLLTVINVKVLVSLLVTLLTAALLTGCTYEEFSSTLIDLEPPCAAVTVSWDDGDSNTCSVDIPERDQGNAIDLTDIVPPGVGTATFRCDSESWINETSSCSAAPTGQRSLAISLTAADGSRIYEYISDAFGEVGRSWFGSDTRDAYWLISDLPTYNRIGAGIDQFPCDGAWDDVITIAYSVSGLSGIGTESAPIVTGDAGATGNFDLYIPGKHFILTLPYPTSILVTSGSVELLDGEPVQITALDATVTFTLDGSGFGVGFVDFDGSLMITNDAFDLYVGPLEPEFNTSVWVWDATGMVDPVTYLILNRPIPECTEIVLLP